MQPRRSIMVTTLHFGDECKTRSFIVILVAIASIFISVGDADTVVPCKVNYDCLEVYEAHFCIDGDNGGCYCHEGGRHKKPCHDSVTTTTTTTTTQRPIDQPKSEKSEKSAGSESSGSDITIGGVATGIFTVYLVILPILCCYIVLSVAVVIMLYIYKKGSKDT